MSMTARMSPLERCGACGQDGVVKGHGKFCSCCGAAVRPAGMRLPRAPRFGWMPLLVLAVVIMGLSSGPMPFLSVSADDCVEGKGTCGESNAEMLRRIDELFEEERERQSRISIENATPDEGGGPKEISIFCPQTPSIKIADLPRYAKEENECLVLHLSAPDLDSRLVMHCDGEFSAPLGV